MRRFPVALAAVGVSAFLVSCIGDQSTTRSLAPQDRPSLVVTPTTCDFNVMKGYARDFFGPGNSPVIARINNLQDSISSGSGLAAVNSAALSIMKQVATDRLTSAQKGTAAQGAVFVDYVFSCIGLNASEITGHTALVLSSGIFEVRGGSTADERYQALAFVKTAAGSRALATPRWGVQPTAALNDWTPLASPAFTGSFLVFGYPKLESAEPGVGAPVAINTNEVGSPSYNAFELGTVPPNSENNTLLVGLCVSPTITGSEEINLLFHNDVIQVNQSPTFCTASDIPGYALLSNKSWFASLASLLAPRALVAEEFDSKLGGLPSGWSPFHSGKLKGLSTALSFTTAPHDATVSGLQNVVVAATVPSTVAGAPPGAMVPAPPGISITLSISGNNGAPSFFSLDGGPLAKFVTVQTGTGGIATFKNLRVTKAGGYLATAAGSLGGLAATLSVTSQMFWIKNK